MKKFNNTLEGTDCGDAGLPRRDTTRASTSLRIVPKNLNTGSTVIQFPMRGRALLKRQWAERTRRKEELR
jgi:hypothetical protein